MFALALVSLALSAPAPQWHADYGKACALAMKDHKDLVIYFRDDNGQLASLWDDADIRRSLNRYVCVRLPESYQFQGERLLDHSALAEMMGKPGLVIVSHHDTQLPFNREVISAHPLTGSRYHWVPSYGVEEVKVILELPQNATLSQRSMIYALRVHPERPRSVEAKAHHSFLAHASRHSSRQASMRHQHHADLIATSNWLAGEVGVAMGGASEVVAESWGAFVGGENVLEAAFSCVDAWRHSPGHWGAVSGEHRYFGYDIARGDNGTWYATGIFAD